MSKLLSILLFLFSVLYEVITASGTHDVCDSTNCLEAATCWDENKAGAETRMSCVQKCLEDHGGTECAVKLQEKRTLGPSKEDLAEHKQCIQDEVCTATNIESALERYTKRQKRRRQHRRRNRKGRKQSLKNMHNKEKKGEHHHAKHTNHRHKRHKKGCYGNGRFLLKILDKVRGDNLQAMSLKMCIEQCDNCRPCNKSCKFWPLLRSAKKTCRKREGGQAVRRRHMNHKEKKQLCECVLTGVGASTEGNICQVRRWRGRHHRRRNRKRQQADSVEREHVPPKNNL